MSSAQSQQQVQHLYQQHHSWIYRWLYHKLGNSCDAADLAQDTFLRVLNKQYFVEIEQPRAYLTKIAKGLMINYIQRKNIERAYLEVLAEHPEYESPSPEQQLLIIESLSRVAQLLDELPLVVQQTFLLSQLEKQKYKDISAQLNISISTVKRNIQRAYAHCLIVMLDIEDM